MNGTMPARNQSVPAIALLVDDLHKTYRRGFWGRRERPAVAGLSLAVERGTVFALLGHNGAGKTTTMKAILGLVRPDRGRIEVCGVDAGRPEARRRVGYLPESPTFHENLTARELLDFHGRLCGLDGPRRRARIDACLAEVGMAEHAGRRFSACSKGMRQRLGLAQALLAEPEVLILDEPQSGLDPQGRRQVREILLARKRAGTTILFSSHIVPDVEAVADQVAMIRHGRVAEVRDLRRQVAAQFSVRLTRPEAHTLPAQLLGQPVFQSFPLDEVRIQVRAASARDLARLLAACAEDGVEVLDVQTAGTALEDAFLAPLEVAAC